MSSKSQPLKSGIPSTRNRRPSHSSPDDLASPSRKAQGSQLHNPSLSAGKKGSSKSESDTQNVNVEILPSGLMPAIRTDHRNKDKCPCNKSVISSWKLDCHKCHQYWHADCMGLGGLTEKEINKLTQWSCPFCWVSPISTFTSDVNVCHVCRNTLSLQQTNLEYEATLARDKLKNVSACCNLIELIDFTVLGKNIETLSQFDQHLKHLLLKEDSLRGLDSEIKNLTEALSKLPSSHADMSESVRTNTESLTSSISQLQEDLKLLNQPQSDSRQVMPEPSVNLLEDISKKLDKLCTDESSISAGLEQLKVSIDEVHSKQQTVMQYGPPAQPPLTSSPNAPSSQPSPIPTVPPLSDSESHVDHKQVPYTKFESNFMEANEAAQITSFLNT